MKRCTYDALDVEALSRFDFANTLVRHGLKDGGLTGVVKTEHKDSRLLAIRLQVAKHTKKSHFVSLSKIMNYYKLKVEITLNYGCN